MSLSYSDQMKKETLVDLVRELDNLSDDFDLLIDKTDTLEIVYSEDLISLGFDDSMKETIKSLELLKQSITEKVERIKSEIEKFEV